MLMLSDPNHIIYTIYWSTTEGKQLRTSQATCATSRKLKCLYSCNQAGKRTSCRDSTGVASMCCLSRMHQTIDCDLQAMTLDPQSDPA